MASYGLTGKDRALQSTSEHSHDHWQYFRVDDLQLTIAQEKIAEFRDFKRTVKVQKSDISAKQNRKADGPQGRNIPPPFQVLSQDCVSAILFGKLLAVATSMNDQQPGQDLGCMKDNFGFIFA